MSSPLSTHTTSPPRRHNRKTHDGPHLSVPRRLPLPLGLDSGMRAWSCCPACRPPRTPSVHCIPYRRARWGCARTPRVVCSPQFPRRRRSSPARRTANYARDLIVPWTRTSGAMEARGVCGDDVMHGSYPRARRGQRQARSPGATRARRTYAQTCVPARTMPMTRFIQRTEQAPSPPTAVVCAPCTRAASSGCPTREGDPNRDDRT